MDSIPDKITLCSMVAHELQWVEEDIKAIKKYRKGAQKDLEESVYDGQVDLQVLAATADELSTIKSRATDALNMVEHILNLYTAAPPREGEHDE